MIVVLGEALIDMIRVVDASGEETFRPVCGGAPFNVSIAIARIQHKTCFIGVRQWPASASRHRVKPAVGLW